MFIQDLNPSVLNTAIMGVLSMCQYVSNTLLINISRDAANIFFQIYDI